MRNIVKELIQSTLISEKAITREQTVIEPLKKIFNICEKASENGSDAIHLFYTSLMLVMPEQINEIRKLKEPFGKDNKLTQCIIQHMQTALDTAMDEGVRGLFGAVKFRLQQNVRNLIFDLACLGKLRGIKEEKYGGAVDYLIDIIEERGLQKAVKLFAETPSNRTTRFLTELKIRFNVLEGDEIPDKKNLQAKLETALSTIDNYVYKTKDTSKEAGYSRKLQEDFIDLLNNITKKNSDPSAEITHFLVQAKLQPSFWKKVSGVVIASIVVLATCLSIVMGGAPILAATLIGSGTMLATGALTFFTKSPPAKTMIMDALKEIKASGETKFRETKGKFQKALIRPEEKTERGSEKPLIDTRTPRK